MSVTESQYWDALGRRWKQDGPEPLWRAHADAVNCALLRRWLPNGDDRAPRATRILKTDGFDEACGPGLLELLASHAATVVVMDISSATLGEARRRHPQLIGAASDVRRLPFAEGSFDVVVSNSTLDHFASFADLECSIAELHRVLRPGGELILTLDNPANPLVALRNGLPFAWLHRVGLVPYYVGATCGPRRLSRLLTHAGFDVADVDAVMHCPRVLAVACARILNGSASPKADHRFLSCLAAFERLSRWPTRFVSGYFTAVRAVKRCCTDARPPAV